MQENVENSFVGFFKKNIKTLFFVFLGVLGVSDFFIHRHHHFKIGEFHLFEAFAGFVFIIVLAFIAKFLKLLFFKSENFYNDK